MTPDLAPFPLGDVALGDGSVFARARDEMLHLARVYPADRLLAVFRANAGLDTRGARPPGGWEEFGHPDEEPWGEADYPGPEAAQTANLLRGHYAGHFLSMLALAAAGEHDRALTDKVDELVAGLGEVQDALAATGRYSHPGFLAAYGEWQFSRLEHFAPYGEIWAPYYTCHKIMAGLLDAHELTGSARALEIVTAMGHWVAHRLGRADPKQRQRMWSLYIAGEFGGMNETLARLSIAAHEPAFLEAARMFDMDDLIDAGARGEDVLTGMHANQHIPQLIGYVEQFELTDDRRYLDAAEGLWHQIVPGRTFAHGGTGESELWGPPDTVAGNIGRRNAETCATYNLLKLARLLFAHTRDPQYMEYTERALLNHILASRRAVRSDTSPEVAYMFPVDPGAVPEFDNIGTCCGGTGLENHVKYQESVFFRAADGSAQLWVNLLAPARLRWEGFGAVEIDADYPWGDAARIRVEPGAPATRAALHIRIPSWARGATIRVGDESVEAVPGQYATVEREWRAGDEVEVIVPRALRAESTVDDPHLQTVMFGPSVLVARSERTTLIDVPLSERRRTDGSIAHDGNDAAEQLRERGEVVIDGHAFRPVWTGSDEKYHMYVRATASEVAIAGTSSGVPARRREDGGTLLDDVWRDPAPHDGSALRDRVIDSVVRARAAGLLSNDEAARVVAAAAAATGAAESRTEEGETGWSAAPDGAIVWRLPADSDAASLPPTVRIETGGPAALTGWFTARPTVHVEAAHRTDEALEVAVRLDDGPWRPYGEPFAIEHDGIVRVEVRATAPDGSIGRGSRELAIDTAAPEVEARVRILGGSAELDFRARDDVSGLERIQWGGEGTFWATFQEAFVRSLTDSEQVIEFSATDRAGNEGMRQRVVLPARSTYPS